MYESESGIVKETMESIWNRSGKGGRRWMFSDVVEEGYSGGFIELISRLGGALGFMA